MNILQNKYCPLRKLLYFFKAVNYLINFSLPFILIIDLLRILYPRFGDFLNKVMEEKKVENLQEKNTHIVVKCIDDNSQSMIRAMYVDESELFVDTTPKCSARGYLTLIITPPINETTQKKVVNDFNTWLTEERKQYHSLFVSVHE